MIIIREIWKCILSKILFPRFPVQDRSGVYFYVLELLNLWNFPRHQRKFRFIQNIFTQSLVKVLLDQLKNSGPSFNSKLNSLLLPLIHWSSVQVNNFTHNLNKVSWKISKTSLCISTLKSCNYAGRGRRNTPVSNLYAKINLKGQRTFVLVLVT